MSWLSKVRNSLGSLKKRDTPDNLWTKCPGCGEMLFTKEFEDNLSVCPRCQYHGRIGAQTRFDQLLDAGYSVLPAAKVPENPLNFRDSKKYSDRIRAARAANPFPDALTNALGAIEGQKVVLGVQDFAFMGGSMGMAVGEAFVEAVERAIAEDCAYVICTAAGGARMQEGILSLMQMPKATVAIRRLARAGLPYIVVLTDPTTGGVTASYAMLGDIQIAEPGALIGFAGQRVIQDTIREKLPDGFQRAEYLHAHGMVDMVVHRQDLKGTLASLLGYLERKEVA
ncbi:acetyl-CoA carboxylase, carboxyltransferase subunit beta [Novosphingobium aerophilum]|uniref:acetyl-CoA carboxylase, carboxyltransferase subunit beta n=1 Tax=Novosphingobium TaxID=165696 RepID=UPI0006C847A7|nr:MULTISPECIES: acetyl-CoA carboxylase, carboxyltransferase subunit beta [unclassified Novosphingobium]KPH62295.1 acetyl-CoA carboxyl transferase [Novosphingobium sp. ST904]MPS67777.1 acetyl-CoA carboxylase carboxyltransferase subunit beta [Novosphingobium sp.]TCM43372.1 acetyl-CoA carboxylase carboxyltransferase subunit alpha [Novosphingobium sp. ST904]WRT92980.1 acetyl-CoA carboxylase, carboxyltransferase subunit beta [Novosphingobium sp. RL4]